MGNIIPALVASLTGALALFFDPIPRIIGFVIILIVGWIIAGLLGSAIATLLRTVRFNDMANPAGFTRFIQRMCVNPDASGLLASIGKRFLRLITLVVALH